MPCATLSVVSRPAPNIVLQDAYLSRDTISQGETVVVYASFHNSGGASGTITWSASVDGVSASKNLNVPASSVVTDSLGLTPNKTGTLTVTVSGAGSTRTFTLTVNPQVPTYTVRWAAYFASGYETLDSLPPTQTVQAGGSASGTVTWTATKTGNATVRLYYSGTWHDVGTVYQISGAPVSFQVGVGNVQSDLNVTVGVKKP